MEDKLRKIYETINKTPKMREEYKGITFEDFQKGIMDDEETRNAVYDDIVAFDLVTPSNSKEFWGKVLPQPEQKPIGVMAPPAQPSLSSATASQAVGRQVQLEPKPQPAISLAPPKPTTITEQTTEQALSPMQDQEFSRQETQRARNEKRSLWEKTKDFGRSIGATFDNMYTKIQAGEQLLGAAQRRLLTFGEGAKKAEEQEVETRQRVFDYLKQVDQKFANEQWKRNIEGSVLDVIERGELNRLPEAVGYTVGQAMIQILPTLATGGYSMYAQTLPDAYKAGVEEVARKTNRTPEQVIEAGDDAFVVANISSGIQTALENLSAGIVSKSIASKGGYRALRDWVIGKTGKKSWSRAAGATTALGAQTLKESGIEVSQEFTGIAGEQAAASTGVKNFLDNLDKAIVTPESQKRLKESAVGGLVGGGGLIIGGKTIQVALKPEMYTPAIINKATQIGPANVVQVVDEIRAGRKPRLEDAMAAELWVSLQESEGNQEVADSKAVLNEYIESERQGLVELPPQELGGIRTEPAPEGAPEFDSDIPVSNEVEEQQPITTFEPVTEAEFAAFQQGQITPERMAGIEEDARAVVEGEMNLEEIEDPLYREMVSIAVQNLTPDGDANAGVIQPITDAGISQPGGPEGPVIDADVVSGPDGGTAVDAEVSDAQVEAGPVGTEVGDGVEAAQPAPEGGVGEGNLQEPVATERGKQIDKKTVQANLENAKDEYRKAKEAFDKKRAELDKTTKEDATDIFGNRKAQEKSGGLFQMPNINPAQREKAIQPFRDRMNKAKDEVNRLTKLLEEGQDVSQKIGFNKAVEEIKAKPLTHVFGIKMGSNQADGTYLSTESENRYAKSNPNLKVGKATVSIENPLVVTDDVGLVDLRNKILNQNLAEFTDEDFQLYEIPDEPTIDDLNDDGAQKLSRLVTKNLKAKGYDSIYFPESKNQEGELIVFDKNKVNFTEYEQVPKASKKVRQAESAAKDERTVRQKRKPVRNAGKSKDAIAARNVIFYGDPYGSSLQYLMDATYHPDLLEAIFGGPSRTTKTGRKNISGERMSRIQFLDKNSTIKKADRLGELLAEKYAEENNIDVRDASDAHDFTSIAEEIVSSYTSRNQMVREILRLNDRENLAFEFEYNPEEIYGEGYNEDIAKEIDIALEDLPDSYWEGKEISDEEIAELFNQEPTPTPQPPIVKETPVPLTTKDEENKQDTEAAPSSVDQGPSSGAEQSKPDVVFDIDNINNQSTNKMQRVGDYIVIGPHVFLANQTEGKKWDFVNRDRLASQDNKNKTVLKPNLSVASHPEAIRVVEAYDKILKVDPSGFKPIINHIATSSGLSAPELLDTFGRGAPPIPQSEYLKPFPEFEKGARKILEKVSGLNDKISSEQIMEDYYLHHFGKKPEINSVSVKPEIAESVSEFYESTQPAPQTNNPIQAPPPQPPIVAETEGSASKDFAPFAQKGEAGRKARAELKEKVGKDQYKLMEEVNKKAPEIIRGLEGKAVEIVCP